jgi:hypothetical protein
MREIDEVRIILNRVFRRHSLNSPTVLARPVDQYTPDRDWPLGWFCHNHGFAYQTWSSIAMSINRITQDRFKLLSSIKLQAYGRGLLVRLREMKLVSTRRTNVNNHGGSRLRLHWDYKALFTRARGDRALRRSRKALGIRKGGPLIWKRLVLRRRAIEEHYIHRNQLGVKLLDFGEP